MNLEMTEILNAVGGRLHNIVNPAKITSVSIDTRTITSGALFVPLKGDNADGHEFINQAAEKGAVCALTENENITEAGIPLVYVKSTRRALLDLANFYRRIHGVKVIAITGSAGKTTTKDMLAAMLSQKYKTASTIKNFNNDIGLPLSVFQLDRGHEILILEMGMNHANEIRELSQAAAPDMAVITNIGDAHIENFENREGILNAKLEITDGLHLGGTVILNGDDPLLKGNAAAEKLSRYNALFPCAKNIVKAEPNGFNETQCHFKWKEHDIHITVPIPGAHIVTNALIACAAAIETGVSPAQITKAFENFNPPDGRLNIFDINEMTVINDVYNANPASMLESIKVLCRKTADNANRRRVAILGDMNELGGTAERHHTETGKFAAEQGIDLLITIGAYSRFIYEGFTFSRAHKEAAHFEIIEEFDPRDFIKRGDIILVKASRGMKFETIIKHIKGEEAWIHQ